MYKFTSKKRSWWMEAFWRTTVRVAPHQTKVMGNQIPLNLRCRKAGSVTTLILLYLYPFYLHGWQKYLETPNCFPYAVSHHLSQVQWKDSWIKSFQPHLQSVKMAQCNQIYHHQWCHSRHPQFTWLSHKGYQHITKHQFQCHQTLCKQGWIHFQTLDFQIKRFE